MACKWLATLLVSGLGCSERSVLAFGSNQAQGKCFDFLLIKIYQSHAVGGVGPPGDQARLPVASKGSCTQDRPGNCRRERASASAAGLAKEATSIRVKSLRTLALDKRALGGGEQNEPERNKRRDGPVPPRPESFVQKNECQRVVEAGGGGGRAEAEASYFWL